MGFGWSDPLQKIKQKHMVEHSLSGRCVLTNRGNAGIFSYSKYPDQFNFSNNGSEILTHVLKVIKRKACAVVSVVYHLVIRPGGATDANLDTCKGLSLAFGKTGLLTFLSLVLLQALSKEASRCADTQQDASLLIGK